MPGFFESNPTNLEEKMIVDLTKHLASTTTTYVEFNYKQAGDTDEERSQAMFKVIKDGALNYMAKTLYLLTGMLTDKEQIPLLVQEFKDIFDCYVNQINAHKGGRN